MQRCTLTLIILHMLHQSTESFSSPRGKFALAHHARAHHLVPIITYLTFSLILDEKLANMCGGSFAIIFLEQVHDNE